MIYLFILKHPNVLTVFLQGFLHCVNAMVYTVLAMSVHSAAASNLMCGVVD